MKMKNRVLRHTGACAAALAAAAACSTAQAQAVGVQLYGVVDNGLASLNNGVSTQRLMVSGGQTASRWGFRGTEDLGDGLAAFFNIEAQMSTDDQLQPPPNLGFQRRSVVGLRGRWGELSLGREYTPAYWSLFENDISKFGLFGTLQSINSLAVAVPRISNAVNYVTPLMGGFTGRAMVAMGEATGATKGAGDLAALGGRDASGGLTASLAIVNLKVAPAATPAGLPVTTTHQFMAGGGYDFGTVRFTAGGGYSNPAGNTNKVTYLHAGGAMRFGASQWLAQVIRFKTEVADGRGSTLGLSYTYDLSKRTNLYASVGKTWNNRTGAFPLNISQQSFTPGATGADVRGVMAGIRHVF